MSRREQKPKSRRTREQQQHIMDLRNGSRTTPIPSRTQYKREQRVAPRHWKDED